ncbi:MAG: hypothetical protein RR555_03860 [Bacteroidales bacterium]
MLISTNTEPHRGDFEILLDTMVTTLKNNSSVNMKSYLKYSSTDLERATKDVLQSCAVGTPFENTIQLVGGQSFPDIIAYNYYGVEVKTTKSNHWKSTGSSVAEGTRVKGIERIFMLFGKLCDPVDFMCKPYEDCLSSVVVTHSPRYLIDMNLHEGETFFDKIDIPYDQLRKQDNPIKTILDYYRKQLKPGETTWWAETGASKSSNMIVRLWSSVSQREKLDVKTKAFCLFPEILGNSPTKYNRMNLWLASVEGIVVPNVRDLFTAGGQQIIEFNGDKFIVPKIITTLCSSLAAIKFNLLDYSIEELQEYWEVEVTPNNVFDIWINLISEYTKRITKFPIKDYILSLK